MPTQGEKRKKILLVCVFSESVKQYCYADSFGPVLSRLGFEVSMFHYRRSFLPGISYAKTMHWPLSFINKKLCNYMLVREVKKYKPDIIFVIKGEMIEPQTLQRIKSISGATLMQFYTDDPFTVWNGNSNNAVLSGLSHYHHVLTWSCNLVDKLQKHGCARVSFFPFAFDQDIFNQTVIMSEDEKKLYTCDVCFAGTWEPERERWLQKLLERMPTLSLSVWGNGWDVRCRAPLVRACVKGPALYGLDMIKLFRCSTIVLNFLRQQNEGSHNMRSFEIPASCAFQLAERSEEHGSLLFKEHENIICFDSVDELVSRIQYFLNAHESRESVLKKSFAHVQNYGLSKQLATVFADLNVLSSKG